MRLLFLTSRLPYPPDRGDRLRVYHFIRNLSRDHEIHLISFIAKALEREHLTALEPYCQDIRVLPLSAARSAITVGLNFWRRQPFQTLYYRTAAMQELIDQKIAETQFDAVYVHLFRMVPYVVSYAHLYRIVDLTDLISQELIRSLPYRRRLSKMIYYLEFPRIARYERKVADTFAETWLISENDRAVLATNCPQANLQVVPNGVDTDRFHPAPTAEISDSLIFVGHLDVFHNVDAASFFVNDILPLVRAEIPQATVKLVGAAPNPQVQALASFPGVEVTGFVDDLNTALNQALVFIAPLRFAAGVQNKVLEAMAAGRAVVTTSLVNQGLGSRAGRDLLVADSPDQIATAILHLMRDQALRQQIGQAARQFVQKNYRWDFVVDRMRVLQTRLSTIEKSLEP